MSAPGQAAPRTQLKTPKGTRDWVGQDLLLRERIFKTASDIFQRHGGVPLDTPMFELRDVLAEKYGEDSRLIYNVEDQGGELLSLRYDLPVPFARWLAMHTNVKQIKRYQIAKVYRRDQPAIARGRLREFYQCDFDIAGVYDAMIPDAEILRIVVEAFRALDLEIVVKLNLRRVLDGLFAAAGVPSHKTRMISSVVDKLDKAAWEEVKHEMVQEKGLPEEVADRVGQYVRQSGSMRQILDHLKSDQSVAGNEQVQSGVADMELLATYLESLGIVDQISFDLSLARGLDYYTGLIYEVIPRSPTGAQASQVGSIAAGGRYDSLVGMYGKQTIPCIGVSLGIDRVFTLLSARAKEKKKSSDMNKIPDLKSPADVYIVAAAGKGFNGLLPERMAIAGGISIHISRTIAPIQSLTHE